MAALSNNSKIRIRWTAWICTFLTMWLRLLLNVFYYPEWVMGDWSGVIMVVTVVLIILVFFYSFWKAKPLRSKFIRVVFVFTLFAALVHVYFAFSDYRAVKTGESLDDDIGHEKIESLYNGVFGGASLVAQYFLDDDEIKHGSESEKPINNTEQMV